MGAEASKSRWPAALCAWPGLVMLLVFLFAVRPQYFGGDAFFHVKDAAYTDLVVARNVAAHQVYGIQTGSVLPASQDAGWRFVLALATRAGVALERAPGMVALAAVVLFMLSTSLILQGLGLRGWRLAAGSLLPALAPCVMRATVEASSVLWTASWVALAFALHLRGVRADGKPLSPMAALCLAVAATVRVELVVIWIA